MDKSKEIIALAHTLEFLDYKAEREPGFVEGVQASKIVSPEKVLKRGIGDLDFDPMYFLGTEITSPEGWAKKKI
jgi:hypothetical protein